MILKQKKQPNTKAEKQIYEQAVDNQEHTNTTFTRILRDITIPLITTTIINHQTIDNPKVLQRHIYETAKTLLKNNNDIPINIEDIYPSDTDTTSSESEPDKNYHKHDA